MKIRRLSEFQGRFPCPDFDTNQDFLMDSFLAALGLKETRKGPYAIFLPRGKLALMFLKHFVGCSDRKLIEYLSLDNFNEGTRLGQTVWIAQSFLKARIKMPGACHLRHKH